jgi:hypothetical protein
MMQRIATAGRSACGAYDDQFTADGVAHGVTMSTVV